MGSGQLVGARTGIIYIYSKQNNLLDKKRDIIRVHSATVRGPVGVWYIILLSVLTIVAPWGRIRGGIFSSSFGTHIFLKFCLVLLSSFKFYFV